MNTKTRSTENRTDLDDRDVRALVEKMTVLPDVGAAKDADDLYVVSTESGKSYTVDVRHGSCGCPDAEHRDPDGGCKHIRRARFATGQRPLPNWVDLSVVDAQLGEHTDGPVAADGGIIVAGDDGEIIDEGEDDDQDGDAREDCWCAEYDVPCFEHYDGAGEEGA